MVLAPFGLCLGRKTRDTATNLWKASRRVSGGSRHVRATVAVSMARFGCKRAVPFAC